MELTTNKLLKYTTEEEEERERERKELLTWMGRENSWKQIVFYFTLMYVDIHEE